MQEEFLIDIFIMCIGAIAIGLLVKVKVNDL